MSFYSPAMNYQADIGRAIAILKDAGCTEGYLFGSVARNAASPQSDIDIAVRGLPPSDYFRVCSILTLSIDTPIDLIDLDEQNSFTEKLLEDGELIRVL